MGDAVIAPKQDVGKLRNIFGWCVSQAQIIVILSLTLRYPKIV